MVFREPIDYSLKMVKIIVIMDFYGFSKIVFEYTKIIINIE